jgi:hypothetical protein
LSTAFNVPSSTRLEAEVAPLNSYHLNRALKSSVKSGRRFRPVRGSSGASGGGGEGLPPGVGVRSAFPLAERPVWRWRSVSWGAA